MKLFTATKSATSFPTNRNKLLAAFSLSLLLYIMEVVILAVDPIMIFARKALKIEKDSVMHEFLKTKVDAVHLDVYLYNLTNLAQFQSGEDHNLKVQEVGPFAYKEMRENVDLELDLDAGKMRYTPKSTVEFLPEDSVGDPKDMLVTMLNIPMLAVNQMISSYPYFTRTMINSMMASMKSKATINIDAHQYLWGYEEPIVKLANTIAPNLVHFNKIGILDRFYKGQQSHLELGATEKDKFLIKKRNGENKLRRSESTPADMCEKCDSFENTYEGIMYPSPVNPDNKFKLYRSGVCKLLEMDYNGTITIRGHVEAMVFNLSDSFFNSSDHEGLLDLSECFFGLPVFISKVHFQGLDPALYERIEGINTEVHKNSYIIVEPKLGLELDTYFPIQVNIVLKDLSHNSEAGKFSNMVIPVLYAEFKQVAVQEQVWSVLEGVYFTFPIYMNIARVLIFLLATSLLAYCIVQIYNSRKLKPISYPTITVYGKVDTGIPILSDFEGI